jgi:hypothetical protein
MLLPHYQPSNYTLIIKKTENEEKKLMFKNTYIIFGMLLTLAATTVAQQDESVLRDVLLGRFTKLQNLIVNYKATKEYTPDLTNEEAVTKHGGGFEVINTGNLIEIKEFSILENRYLYDQHIESWDRKITHPVLSEINLTKRKLNVFNPDRSEHLFVFERGRPRGAIRNQKNLPKGDIDIALGLRKQGQPELLTDMLIKEMLISQPNSDKVILRDIDARGRTHEWIFDLKLGYALTGYKKLVPPDNRVNIEYIMEDFKNVDGIFLPFKIRSIWKGKDNKILRTDNIEIIKYKLNDPNNTPERYRIKWPEGTNIMDTRSGIPFSAKDGRMTYTNDEEIFNMALDEITNAEVKEPTTSIPSNDIDKQEDVNAIENKSANLPVGDIVPQKKAQKPLSQFLWAGVFAIAVVFIGLFMYKKHKTSP